MTKSLRLPLFALLAASTLLAAAPAVQAAQSSKSLLKKIYKKSKDGDGGDIYAIIKQSLQQDSAGGDELLKKLHRALKKNHDQIDAGVTDDDLESIFNKLRRYLKRHPHHEHTGPIRPPESPIVNP